MLSSHMLRQGVAAAGLVAGGIGIGLAARPPLNATSNASAPDEEVLARLTKIEKRFNGLEQKMKAHDEISRAPRDNIGHIVDQYVEWWHEANKADVDAGTVDFPVIGKVDLFPDSVEKHMYSTMFKAMVNQMLYTEVCIAGVRMRMEPLDLHKDFVAPRASSSQNA